MNVEERQQLAEEIERQWQQIREEIARLEEETKPIAPENAIGRISRMDAINNKSIAEAGLRAARAKLQKLETALRRIEDPDFGSCLTCGKPIPTQRLLLMPGARRCVPCASR